MLKNSQQKKKLNYRGSSLAHAQGGYASRVRFNGLKW